MTRQTRSSQLETRSARLRLPVSRKAKFVKLAPGVGLGYRRTKSAGTWVVRVADGKGGNWEKALGNADDFAETNGETVFDFWGRRSARSRSPQGRSPARNAPSRSRWAKRSTTMKPI